MNTPSYNNNGDFSLPENPLLPNAELRALRTWTKRARKHWKTAAAGSREALLAGTLLQLRPGDMFAPEPGETETLTSKDAQAVSILNTPATAAHLLHAAGLAAANKRSGSDRLVLALTHTGLTNSWTDALAWAQTEELPLILAVADPSGANAFRTDSSANPAALTWASLSKLARKLKLPVLSVDGEDAVAVYRVMQESVLRARSGAGPAVLWAMLPTSEDLGPARPPSAAPLRRLERYMRTRNISF